MMNISRMYDSISCTADLIDTRFSSILAQLKDPKLVIFRIQDWNTVSGVGKPNKFKLEKLIEEYANESYYFIGDNWNLDNIKDSDFTDDSLLLILHDSESFGLLTICDNDIEVTEILCDIFNNVISKSKITASKSSNKEVTEIKPMIFYDYFRKI